MTSFSPSALPVCGAACGTKQNPGDTFAIGDLAAVPVPGACGLRP